METLAEVIDGIFFRETRRAADLARHWKALEMAVGDGSWSRAKNLELLELSGALLASRDEEYELVREVKCEARMAFWPPRDSAPTIKGGSKGLQDDSRKVKAVDSDRRPKPGDDCEVLRRKLANVLPTTSVQFCSASFLQFQSNKYIAPRRSRKQPPQFIGCTAKHNF